MKKLNLVAPCLFGLEAVLKKEISDLGLEIINVDDGRVKFKGEFKDVVRCNLYLRTAERVLIELASDKVLEFEDLFQLTYNIPFEDFIPSDGKFNVTKASSIKSKLFSGRDIQRIVKKAAAKRLLEKHGVGMLSERGAYYPIRVFIKKDIASIYLDTSLQALHRRGYRIKTSKAPLTETLAAGIVMLSGYDGSQPFIDPFCGSGTIVIEAAMIAKNIAPGLNGDFVSENWSNLISKKMWIDEVNRAFDKVNEDVKFKLIGYDIDHDMVKLSMENAMNASVEDVVHFEKKDVKDIINKNKNGIIVSNPPYGERIRPDDLKGVYMNLAKAYKNLKTWDVNFISSYEGVEKTFSHKAKKRKLYNGMLKTYLYKFRGNNI